MRVAVGEGEAALTVGGALREMVLDWEGVARAVRVPPPPPPAPPPFAPPPPTAVAVALRGEWEGVKERVGVRVDEGEDPREGEAAREGEGVRDARELEAVGDWVEVEDRQVEKVGEGEGGTVGDAPRDTEGLGLAVVTPALALPPPGEGDTVEVEGSKVGEGLRVGVELRELGGLKVPPTRVGVEVEVEHTVCVAPHGLRVTASLLLTVAVTSRVVAKGEAEVVIDTVDVED